MLIEEITNIIKDFNYTIEVVNDLAYLQVDSNNVYEILLLLKNNSFEVLIDYFAMPAVDNHAYTVCYHLLNYKNNRNICLYTNTENSIQSIIDIFPNANWCEREIYEMYNINFIGHNNLQKLFTE